MASRSASEDSTAFFAQYGFAEVESQSTVREAYGLNSLSRLYSWLFALTRLSASGRNLMTKSSRVVRLERRKSASSLEREAQVERSRTELCEPAISHQPRVIELFEIRSHSLRLNL